MKVYKSLKELFKEDTSLSAVIDSYLLVTCCLCNQLFLDSASRSNHELNICLKRFLSLSVYYGMPVSTEVHDGLYGANKRKESETEHCFNQIKKLSAALAQEISLLNVRLTTTPPAEDLTDGAESKQQILQRVINNECGTDVMELDNKGSSGEERLDMERELRKKQNATRVLAKLKKVVSPRKVVRYFLAESEGGDNDDHDDDDDDDDDDDMQKN